MKITMKPADFECTLAECPPGLFLWKGESICLKSEYGDDAYCDSGEYFWGGTADKKLRANLKVLPLEYKVEPHESQNSPN